MPELPEVETTCRGIAPHITGTSPTAVTVRQSDLRWPVPPELTSAIKGNEIRHVRRRAKYILIGFDSGTLMIHLGMTGKLFITDIAVHAEKHDHIDIALDNGRQLRFNDARRFGSVHWIGNHELDTHFLLANLGIEPLSNELSGDYLYANSRQRSTPVKSFLMDNRILVGVGNIYASESLFRAGIRPTRKAGQISKSRYNALAAHVKEVLGDAIECGGTTLRDYANGENKPGYFSVNLAVYGRDGQPCPNCASDVLKSVIGQRSTFYCPKCQR